MSPTFDASQLPTREPKPVPSVRPMTAVEKQAYEDLEWAVAAPEVQQHVGKLVVIHRKRVVAFGTDQGALLKQAAAQEQCLPGELVVVVVPPLEFWEVPD